MKDRHLFDNHSILFVLSLSLGIMLLVSIGPTGINEGQGKDFLGNEPSRAGIFDGLDIDYIWTTSFMGVYNFNITYAHVSGSDYSETIVIEGTGSALSNVNNDTRVISSTSGLYSEGSHNPHFINTPVAIGTTVPVSIYYEGDHDFNVTGTLVTVHPALGMIEVYVLVDLVDPSNVFYYEASTGILVSADVTFMMGMYTYSYELTATNAPVTFGGNDYAPELSGDSVSPASGTQATGFNFTVTYTDADDNAPVYINVVVAATPYPLAKVNMTDGNYTDGCQYSAVVYLQPGSYSHFFECGDGMYTDSTTSTSGPNVTPVNDHVPSLTMSSASPSNGFVGNLFTFKVTYTDQDNNVPTSITVTYNGTTQAMTKQYSSDANYMDGCIYQYSVTLSVIGNYVYHFNASDGLHAASMGPFSNLNVNAFSSFITTGIFIEHDLLFSLAGTPEPSRFEYTLVNATHADVTWDSMFGNSTHTVGLGTRIVSNSTSFILTSGTHTHAWIHTNASIGIQVPVAAPGLGDLLYTVTGETVHEFPNIGLVGAWILQYETYTLWYEKSTGILLNGTIPYLTMGYLEYTFNNTNAPVTFAGCALMNPSVTPATGSISTAFKFTVDYISSDNLPPDAIDVILDGVAYPMSQANASDTDFTDGAGFIYENSSMDGGTHQHAFFVSKGPYSYRIPSSGFITGPTVIPYEYSALWEGKVEPARDDEMASYTFSVVYQDTLNASPSWVRAVVDGTEHAMIKDPANDDFVAGVVYTCTVSNLAVGGHSFYFTADNGTVVVRDPVAGSHQGPAVIRKHFTSEYSEMAPVIDGTFNPAEWVEAFNHEEVFRIFNYMDGSIERYVNMSVYFMNDNNTLHVCVIIKNETFFNTGSNGDRLMMVFDNNNNGVLEDDESAWLWDVNPTSDYYTSHDALYDYGSWGRDIDAGGTEDGTSAMTHTNPVHGSYGNYIFESTIPLDSADWSDFNLVPGDTIGFKIAFLDFNTGMPMLGFMPLYNIPINIDEMLDVSYWGSLEIGLPYEPPSVTSPPDSLVVQNSTGNIITWHVTTENTPGQYRILRNGFEIQAWQSWANDSDITVTANTSIGLGQWTYRIEFNDNETAGTPDEVIVTVNDHPVVSGGTSINGTSIRQDEPGMTIDWTINDQYGGAGQYQVLLNGTPYISLTPYALGTPLDVPVDTSLGFGDWNYTLRYNDMLGFAGNESQVIITIVDAPRSNHPGDMFVLENAAGVTIDWLLTDSTGASHYRVLLDGSVTVGWTSWTNNSWINVTVDTASGLGTFNYTIEFNSSRGVYGFPDTVMVTVNDIPEISSSPSPATIQEDAPGVTISWTLLDALGPGTYNVTINGSAHVSLQSWTSGVSFSVPVDTGRGIGDWEYIITYTDSNGVAGTPGSVIITIDDTPTVTDVQSPGTVLEGTSGVTINWTITDLTGSGMYTVLLDAVPIITSQPWTSGIPIPVPVDTGNGIGSFNYTITYQDSNGFAGLQNAVLVTVNDVPQVATSPGAVMFQEGAPGRTVSWTITDGVGPGTYSIAINSTPYIIGPTSWINNTPITVPVDTGRGIGDWNYTITFTDSNGQPGTPSSAIITIDDTPTITDTQSPSIVLQGTPGITINWTMADSSGGGTYTVLRNGATIVTSTPWTSGVQNNVTIVTSIPAAVYNFTIRYQDANGFHGTQDTVMVTIDDIPVLLTHPPSNLGAALNQAGVQLTWRIYDAITSGNYTVFRNDIPVAGHEDQPWTIMGAINVSVITSGYGTFNYTIVYEDGNGNRGTQGTCIVIIDAAPVISGTPPPDTVATVGASGASITWTLTDGMAAGNYTVLVNGISLAGHVNVPWTNNTPFSVPIDTTTIGVNVYTLSFWDGTMVAGTPDSVIVRINGYPWLVSKTTSAEFTENATGKTISWTLADEHAPGNYTVLVNGVPLASHAERAWTNASALLVVVDTNRGLGTWNYTVLFVDSDGLANQSTVMVTIVESTGTSLVDFLLDIEQSWWLYAIIGVGVIVGVAGSVNRSRKHKVEASKKALPEIGFYDKTLSKKAPSYDQPAGDAGGLNWSVGDTDSAVQAPPRAAPARDEARATSQARDASRTQGMDRSIAAQQPAPQQRNADFYCATCKQKFEIPDFTGESWFACPTCNASLAFMKRCDLCGNSFAVRQEDFLKYKNMQVPCPVCKQSIVL